MTAMLPMALAATLLAVAPLERESLPPGPLPGKRVPGYEREVRELVRTGAGATRTSLLIARGRHGELCLSARVRGHRAPFRCLASWDRPPLIVRVGIGGDSRAAADWITVVGLVRSEVQRVRVESQTYRITTPPPRSFPGFPYKAFAVGPTRGNMSHTVIAQDGQRTPLQAVELSWAYRSPCQEKRGGCTTRAERRGRWAEARDPVTEPQSARMNGRDGARAKRLATDHPVVRQLIAGQAFSMGAVAEWSRCNGRRIGAQVQVRLARAVTFDGVVPVYGNSIHTAYTEGTAHLRVERGAAFRIAVDLNRDRVVGIFPDVDVTEGLSDAPPPKVDLQVIGTLTPAGGPDQGKPCEPKPGA